MNGMLDYLKLEIEGYGLEVAEDVGMLDGLADEYISLANEGKRSGTSTYHKVNVGDKTIRLWWECWGPVSDYMLDKLPTAWFSRVKRLDWREEMTNPPQYTREELHAYALKHMHPYCRVTLIDAPPSRKRKGGRDSGGKFLGCGSHGSAGRVIHNQRVGEPPYTEAQIGARGIPEVLERAKTVFQGEPFVTLAQCVREVMRERHDELCKKWFGQPLLYITGEALRPDQHLLISEGVLDRMRALLEVETAETRGWLLGNLMALHLSLCAVEDAYDVEPEPEPDEPDEEPEDVWGVGGPHLPFVLNCATYDEAVEMTYFFERQTKRYEAGEITTAQYELELSEKVATLTPLRITPRVTHTSTMEALSGWQDVPARPITA
jgi:hypothetical protein